VSVDAPSITWGEDGMTHSLRWHSEAGVTSPRRIVVADDRMTADAAWRLACEGTALLWRGDFQNARQLLQAMARRIERKPPKQAAASSASASFHQYRLAQAQRARTLGMLLLPFDDGYRIPLRRAPDVCEACVEAYGPASGPFAASLRELLGVIGAHEWRKKGVPVGVLGARIHPHYGVFSPVRGEYVALVAQAPLPPTASAPSISVPVAACWRPFWRGAAWHGWWRPTTMRGQSPAPRTTSGGSDLSGQVEVVAADLFPSQQAQVVVCNPPWLPGRAGTALERAVYDPDSRMLQGFLAGLAARLAPGGEGWLILSDLAEHLGLRSRDELLAAFARAGLEVAGRLDAAPTHGRASDRSDPLHAARSREITSLWRLRPASAG
jgi:hypothetical protein